jgi:hypothetical protein
MKPFIQTIVLLTGFFISYISYAQDDYHTYFTKERFRYDFLLAGNAGTVHLYPVGMSLEPYWAGPLKIETDFPDFGSYRYNVTDEATGKLLFRKGFCTLFQEWQTTGEAKTVDKSYYQAVFFPFPKNKVKLTIEFRDRDGKFQPLHEVVIDPSNYFINRENPDFYEVIKIIQNGKPETHVDLVFLSEGYTAGEKEKFTADIMSMCDYMFNVNPFSKYRERFNVLGVWAPSQESGTDVPGEHVYLNTGLNSTFYTFDLDRYLTTSDMKSIYDIAAGVSWDHLFVLVNTTRYGGGGFYNLVCVGSSGHALSKKVMVHEFGHAFAGLADEYYNSSVSYEDFYNLKIEPWEPNITTLVDFDSKWKPMLPDSIPVPTPRTKPYARQLGVYEGGGYMAKGIFSPMQDCRMKSNITDDFCPVCREAIRKTIEKQSAPE